MQRSDEAMIFIGNFKKNYFISLISIAKPKGHVVFAFSYVSDSPALFYGYFWMNLDNVDSNEAMKQGHEVLNASSLHRYNFLLSVKHFIAITF